MLAAFLLNCRTCSAGSDFSISRWVRRACCKPRILEPIGIPLKLNICSFESIHFHAACLRDDFPFSVGIWLLRLAQKLRPQPVVQLESAGTWNTDFLLSFYEVYCIT